MSDSKAKPFLSAEWRHLVMLNYAVPREVLRPFVPAGTALDNLPGRGVRQRRGFSVLEDKGAGDVHPVPPGI